MLLPLHGNGGNALSLPAQPTLSYPCNDKLPLNFQTCRWASDIGKDNIGGDYREQDFHRPKTGNPRKLPKKLRKVTKSINKIKF